LLLCGCQYSADAVDTCTEFARSFRSTPVDTAALDSDYLMKPLRDSVKRPEAGFDPSRVSGGVADIYIQCAIDNTVTPLVIIRSAPVIATDPEGFTVLIISNHDHQELKGQSLFRATCDDGV
jgi:hypothetical protein